MKKKILYIFTLLIIFILTSNVFAENTTTSSNLFSFNNNISIDKDVDGDVYAFGQTISIDNLVLGDIISAAKDISIESEEVKGNIRIVGQKLDINVKNTKNITAAAENISISKDTNSNAIYAAARSINFKGYTNDLYASGETIFIDGIIKGDLNVDCETLVLMENAEVMGNIKVKSPNQPVINSKITLNDIDYEKVTKGNEVWLNKSDISWEIMSICTAILMGFIIYIIFKKSFIEVDRNLKGIIKYLLIVLSTLILIPMISIIMIITIIGMPIGIIILILYSIIMYLCPVIVGIMLGKILFTKSRFYIQILGGIIIIRLIMLIPYISFVAWLLSLSFVMGFVSIKIYLLLKAK